METRVFVENLLSLHSSNKETLLSEMMRAAYEILKNPRLLGVEEGEDPKAIVEFATHMMEKANREKIDKYRLWIINQALVIYCTILDTFLESIVEAILRQNVKILYGVSAGKNIDLKKLIELGSVDAVIQEVRAKEVKAFSHDDINRRFEYLEAKLGLAITKAFDWSGHRAEIQTQLKDWNLKTLEEVYHKRNAVVHRDETPIGSDSELDTIAEFFLQTLNNIAFLAHQKHNVPMDLVLLAGQQTLYQQFKDKLDSAKT